MAGRPREFDRETALRKAKLVFWQRGYEGTSISDLVTALGIASARIYAAFGSKENLFREAVALYLSEEGAFADTAMHEPNTYLAIEKLLTNAVKTYTQQNQPRGCMVVLSLTNYSSENEEIMFWLANYRLARTASIIQRLKKGIESGDLPEKTDAQALGDYFATLLHGISIQARDGISREHLLAMVAIAMRTFDVIIAQNRI
ncbi:MULTISPECIES: TetR/AcrR family transcriptional regulator [Providencia]|uniref:TetR family transcriptional regulator n=1 Tax=Providencia heimbachae ATCC 35613 TaxID=1354272 RepID=A0A1B7K146_9GAMM|nr:MULTISPECIES: TetR/AcrR family transcriptional regulator [Providencia]MBP6120906.1 TetR/AcrR family transcriptional regulator [Providencia sp.]MDD9341397.1 TetR/AcrR family transcriptional regulator [Providencia heimbachae]NIH23449.1 TetR/AcrR family transcriptional regulator [Providencia heimbachae]OAT53724.1 TetR family transcriptional regulator [Providencia heimbachae ATCC 35613]QCJ70922.1 TetR/AcrR family transcriptional regulator [Providencia heimbachae]